MKLLRGARLKIDAKAVPGTEIRFSASIGSKLGGRGYGSFKIIGVDEKVLSGGFSVVSQQGCDTPKIADGADLMICECYFYEKPIRFHLNYPTIRERRHELKAKQIVLTHLGPEMLTNRHRVPETCADDGMVIEI